VGTTDYHKVSDFKSKLMAEIYPYTVVWYCPTDHSLEINQVYAAHPNDAVQKAVDEYDPDHELERADVELICVLVGHNERAMVEWDDRFRWFQL
jgi:hypothetical protein